MSCPLAQAPVYARQRIHFVARRANVRPIPETSRASDARVSRFATAATTLGAPPELARSAHPPPTPAGLKPGGQQYGSLHDGREGEPWVDSCMVVRALWTGRQALVGLVHGRPCTTDMKASLGRIGARSSGHYGHEGKPWSDWCTVVRADASQREATVRGGRARPLRAA